MHEETRMAQEREQEASKALNEQENFLRRQDYLSDEELTENLLAGIRREKAIVESWLDSGDCFVLSSAGKVHLPQCSSMRQFMDREAAWAPYLRDLERVRDWSGDTYPSMPVLRTRAQVEDLKAYKTCPMCAPTLDHSDKRQGVRGWTLLKAGSLKAKHFGKTFSLAGGSSIGVLTEISTVETAQGLDFRAEFDGLAAPVTDPMTQVMYRTPRPTH
ncbi:hypothetical protein [Arthrobacter sp. zg-Y179]|uniref:hypothetical protein n=1 Tax=Arthrobacter sp. zg-Y179 TaxID=2894188 RepID=UPI001E4ED8C6|nr:hypothetical protein [Arthrobacter sp. zg-Y179]MCC9175840.1 hypothetical protein [Arthrobacter sp. zg-Y179]